VSSRIHAPTRKALWVVLAVAAAIWGVAVFGIFGYEWLTLRLSQFDATVGDKPPDPFRKLAIPGIVRPSVVEAGASKLRDDEEVIGFEIGGRARAYRLDAFRDRSTHIVNDLVGEVPITVAYCDLSDCVRGYTGGERDRPLDVAVGGLYRGRDMVLEVSGTLYFQESGTSLSPGVGPSSIPLERLSPTRTTWGEWKRLHPSTDVYEGVR
jgi:Protein of unknown function (DUF3179)